MTVTEFKNYVNDFYDEKVLKEFQTILKDGNSEFFRVTQLGTYRTCVIHETLVQVLGQKLADGHNKDKIEKDTDRDRYMSSEEAKDYGIVDHVVMERGKSGGSK